VTARMTRWCRCVDKANAALAKQNEELVLAYRRDMGVIRTLAVVSTQKLDPSKRTKLHVMVANFCPFCGKKYPKRLP
jgi:hypothetical protein